MIGPTLTPLSDTIGMLTADPIGTYLFTGGIMAKTPEQHSLELALETLEWHEEHHPGLDLDALLVAMCAFAMAQRKPILVPADPDLQVRRWLYDWHVEHDTPKIEALQAALEYDVSWPERLVAKRVVAKLSGVHEPSPVLD